jgi:O-antigen/teichoic acid export membrane protein
MSAPLSTQAIYLFIGKLSALLITVFIPVILARVFSKEELGLYFQIILIATVLIEIAKWGVVNSLYYYYSTSSESRSELLSQSFYLLLILGFIVAMLAAYFNIQIYSFLNISEESGLVWVIIIYVVLMLMSLILDSIYILEERIHAVVVYEIVSKGVKVALILFSIFMYGTVVYIVYFLTIYAFIKFIFLYSYLNKNYRISIFKINKFLLADQVKYCFPIGAARLVGEVSKKADKFILISLLSPAVYSTYSIAYFGIPIITLLISSITQVVIPKMALNHKYKKELEIKNLWHKVICQYALIVIPIICLFEVLARDIIVILFTNEYIDSVVLYQIFLLSVFLQILAPSVVLRSVKKTKVIFYSHFLSAITAIVCGYFLIKSHGMVGGAISFILASATRTVVQIVAIKKILILKFTELIPWFFIFRVASVSIFSSLLVIILPISSDIVLISAAVTSLLYLVSVVLLYLMYGLFDLKNMMRVYHSALKARKS